MRQCGRIRKAALGLVLLAALGTTGCASYFGVGLAPSTTPIVSPTGEARKYRVIAHDTGESKRTYLFYFIRWGKNLVDEAVQDAVTRHQGDAMINVTVDTKITNILIVQTVKTIVEGDVIKFEP